MSSSSEHELESGWNFWGHLPCWNAEYSTSRMRWNKDPVLTIESFWRHHNNLPSPSSLQPHNKYEGIGLFRSHVEPEWEHSSNVGGHRLTFRIESTPGGLDALWLEALLVCVGETIPHSEWVNGVRMVWRRSASRLEVWYSATAPSTLSTEGLEEEVKKCVFANLGETVTVSAVYWSKNEDKCVSTAPDVSHSSNMKDGRTLNGTTLTRSGRPFGKYEKSSLGSRGRSHEQRRQKTRGYS